MWFPLLRTLLVVAGVSWLVCDAQAGKVGPEFRVNQHTVNHQWYSSVASLTGGGFVVTWQSDLQDGSGYGVYGQRYTSAGARIGGEFRVNTYTAGGQSGPSVAGLAGGGFVVTWSSENQDGPGSGVYGQRYKASGERLGQEFRINTRTIDFQWAPSVAGLVGGGFVVTWVSRGQDGSGDGVYGQRYTSAGARAGLEFRVNTYTNDTQYRPSVASLLNGGFVITWSSVQDGGVIAHKMGIYGQRYGAAGARVGAEFRVNTYTKEGQVDSSTAGLNNGGFVAIWNSYGQDGSSWGIYGQRYNQYGAARGGEFRVNSYTTDTQGSPSVARLGNGGFVVTWFSFQDGSGAGVYGQRYTAAGARFGGEFRINTFTLGAQGPSSVAGLGNGGFVVIWDSENQDGSGRGVYGQRYSAD